MAEDAIAVLVKDHREVEDMFAQLEAFAHEPERMKKIADDATIELVRHSVAEEEYLYPYVKDHLPSGEAIADEELHHHAEIEETLKQLEGMSGDNVEFLSTAHKLMTQVRAHVQEEEGELFPLVRRETSQEELDKLGEKLTMAKKVAPTRPHPSAPDEPPMDKILGPGIGLVDRVRDALSGRGSR